MFKRKVYQQLKYWKENLAPGYACLLEGARRVGKTTIAEEFAKNEYETYILIDFADITPALLDVFRDISNRDLFFLKLQTETGIQLIERKSVIIFDEIQFFPKAACGQGEEVCLYLVKRIRSLLCFRQGEPYHRCLKFRILFPGTQFLKEYALMHRLCPVLC